MNKIKTGINKILPNTLLIISVITMIIAIKYNTPAVLIAITSIFGANYLKEKNGKNETYTTTIIFSGIGIIIAITGWFILSLSNNAPADIFNMIK